MGSIIFTFIIYVNALRRKSPDECYHRPYFIRKYTQQNIIITHPNPAVYVNIMIYCPDRIIIVPLCFIRACVFRVTVS
jgi:hypothetical protein